MAKFFQTPKPRSFHVEPRYWNPEKEKRDERERRIKSEMGQTESNGTYQPYIGKGMFKQGISKGKWGHASERRKSNTRLMIIVAILAALVYFMLK